MGRQGDFVEEGPASSDRGRDCSFILTHASDQGIPWYRSPSHQLQNEARLVSLIMEVLRNLAPFCF